MRIPLVLLLGLAFGGPLAATAQVRSQVGPPTDDFLAGYVTAMLERELGIHDGAVNVHAGVVTITAPSLNAVHRQQIVQRLSRVTGVKQVEVVETVAVSERAGRSFSTPRARWLPPGQLFEPLLADPRWPRFSLAYLNQSGSQVARHVGALSLGQAFSLYRQGWSGGEQWELILQPGVFSLFDAGDLTPPRTRLVNTDYLVAAGWAVRRGDLTGLARIIHLSSHLGDEYMVDNPGVTRVNFAWDALDVLVARRLWDGRGRFYAGGRLKVKVEPKHLDKWSLQYGLEWQGPLTGVGGAVRPIAAVDVQQQQENGWGLDLSLRAGVALRNPFWDGRQLQVLAEYYNGHSPDGQFFEDSIHYLGLGVHLSY